MQFEGICPKCKTPNAFEVSGPVPVNLEVVSQIIIQHSGEKECTYCHAILVPVVVNIENVNFRLIEAASEKNIIIPTEGRLM